VARATTRPRTFVVDGRYATVSDITFPPASTGSRGARELRDPLVGCPPHARRNPESDPHPRPARGVEEGRTGSVRRRCRRSIVGAVSDAPLQKGSRSDMGLGTSGSPVMGSGWVLGRDPRGSDHREPPHIPTSGSHPSCSTMPAPDATVRRGLPVTSVHRTLIDLGNDVHPDDVELAYECARRRRQTNDEWLLRRIEEMGTQGRSGPAILKAIIERHSGAAPTGSALEVRFLHLNRRFQLPEPERQRVVRNRDGSTARVDFIYPGTVVVVEVDGRSVHQRKRQWEQDLRRRNRLTAKGFRVLHVTYERMKSDPSGIAEEINAALGRSFV
jgi:very-short-patch-repair endonuclease